MPIPLMIWKCLISWWRTGGTPIPQELIGEILISWWRETVIDGNRCEAWHQPYRFFDKMRYSKSIVQALHHQR